MSTIFDIETFPPTVTQIGIRYCGKKPRRALPRMLRQQSVFRSCRLAGIPGKPRYSRSFARSADPVDRKRLLQSMADVCLQNNNR